MRGSGYVIHGSCLNITIKLVLIGKFGTLIPVRVINKKFKVYKKMK